ncbi:permease [Halorussus amylolyticus]|uniref:permease n=1 Tax=Halorussus amylolyticus TaxID=1126242 RepID=UPI0010490F81|nr:permease [Halorussus amylolyticus]
MVGLLTGDVAAAWDFFVHLAVVLIPLFVAGAFLVGLLQEYMPPERVEGILRRHDGGTGNAVAAGIGAVTPFCSCSTVPVLAGLLGAGAPLGLAFSFLLASPLVNELAVILLVGLFGLEVAAAYVGLTLVAAVVGGIVIGRLDLEAHVKDVSLLAPDESPDGDSSGDSEVATDGGTASCGTADSGTAGCGPTDCGTADAGASESCCDSGCGGGTPRNAASHRERVGRAATGAREFFVDLLPYLLLGMTLGAIVHGFVPASVVLAVIGPENPLAVPIAAIAGAPIYVSMSAMLPVAASFAEQGVQIGTVLAFVVGSAGVSIPNLILLNKLFDRTLLATYAVTVVATGVVVGLAFNAALA